MTTAEDGRLGSKGGMTQNLGADARDLVRTDGVSVSGLWTRD
jgi:hypothetical protein